MKFLSTLYNLEICKRISELKVQLKNIIAVFEKFCAQSVAAESIDISVPLFTLMMCEKKNCAKSNT